MVTVLIKRLGEVDDLPLPRYETEFAAGMDVCAGVETPVTVAPGDIVIVPCAFAIALPAGFEAQIRPRSGLASHYGVTLANAPATIDADYRGEIKVPLINLGRKEFVITRGMRIAQLLVAPVSRVTWSVTESLPATSRDDGGFGHTGI